MVSRNTPRRNARAEELVEELSLGAAVRMKCNADDVERIVRAVVAYLVEEYPAQDLYIPASLSAQEYPLAEIRAAMASGESVRSLCRRFHIHRRKLYRLLDEHEDCAA